MKIKIVKGDITKIPATIVVNAANNMLMSGGGVCGAIYKAAGYELNAATTEIMVKELGNEAMETGSSVMTPSFNMTNCENIVHAVGPIYNPALGDKLMSQMLTDAYESAINFATATGASSISFPAISTGIYGYPMDKALKVVKKVLETTSYDGKIILVCFEDKDFAAYKSEIKPWKIYFKRMKQS